MLTTGHLSVHRSVFKLQRPMRMVLVPMPVHTVIKAAKGEVIPSPQEEKEAAHSAFLNAYEASKPIAVRMPGLQQFAAAVWERRRRIPSSTYNDPLDHIFTEFDEDGDGHLTSVEIANALASRGVEAKPEQVQEFIDAIDVNKNGTVERNEFADFIFHLAVADLKTSEATSGAASEAE